MEIRRYIFILRRWLWLIALTACLAAVTSFFISRAQIPVYQATSTLLVMEGSGNQGEYSDLLTSERLAMSYSERLTNYYVLQEAISSLEVEIEPTELEKDISVRLIGNTQLVALSVEHVDPVMAADLANAIPTIFAERNRAQQLARFADTRENMQEELVDLEKELAAAELMLKTALSKVPPDETAAAQANEDLLRLHNTQARLLQSFEELRLAAAQSQDNIVVDEFAQPPHDPIRPRTLTNILLAAAIGVVLALGVAILVEYLDDTVKNPADIEKATGLGTLGALEYLRISRPLEALIVAMEPRSPAAEAYRQVRTNIQFIDVDHESKTLLVTSSHSGEGKTTVAANLAAALAQSGKRVLLVDCDMRRPTLNTLLEVSNSYGLSELIIRGRYEPSVIMGTLIPNLKLLSAGQLPPNPAELLGTARMKAVVEWLKSQADYVVFDSPPVLAVTDAVVLSKLVDSVLFVVSAAHTRYPALLDAVRRLTAVDAQVAGVILNKIDAKRGDGYYLPYYKIDYQPGHNGRKTWRQRLAELDFAGIFN